ncbi:hypothetical protein ASPBRDRAFT_36907 [Aspergillus brasiliensis CBS 101740]|uniref:Uncharacterized protein n=1 Tax=Aspergillus brasiliensis (strain CBS 101740 / IMI 381727 / IBT 21946) TaxID=767769 RepID=A0A1L9V179_ASPBC|nr:hypothetical protein ASPBRDRAFT_36907 [Aspergillus brasiliensis CBS 101740]
MTDHQNRCNCPEQEAVTPSRSPQQPVILTLGSESLSGQLIGDASWDGRKQEGSHCHSLNGRQFHGDHMGKWSGIFTPIPYRTSLIRHGYSTKTVELNLHLNLCCVPTFYRLPIFELLWPQIGGYSLEVSNTAAGRSHRHYTSFISNMSIILLCAQLPRSTVHRTFGVGTRDRIQGTCMKGRTA